MLVPPSGHVAGVWARTDATRGVHKAPGQRGPARRQRPRVPDHPATSRATSTRTGSTASARSRAAASASGARARCRATRSGATSTCAGSSTTSPSRSWRARSGRSSSPTTSGCGCSCGSRPRTSCTRTWREGALFGATPEQAFYVKCDAETNPPDVVEAGQVIVEIGIAPVKPAEFVVFRHQPVLRPAPPRSPSRATVTTERTTEMAAEQSHRPHVLLPAQRSAATRPPAVPRVLGPRLRDRRSSSTRTIDANGPPVTARSRAT